MENKSAQQKISDLVYRITDLKERYRYYQKRQQHAKHDLLLWDPYDGLTKEQHEIYYRTIIEDCRYLLNSLQNEIKEVRKEIKKLNREQNLQNNAKEINKQTN